MVAVVVINVHAVPGAGEGEAALDAAEACKPLGDQFGRDTQALGDRDGGRGVGNVVATGHRQAQVLHRNNLAGAAAADFHVENRGRAIHADVGKADVRLRVLAVGDDLAVLDAGCIMACTSG